MSRFPLRMALPAALAALVNAASASGAEPQALLEKYRCNICHSEREAAAGPAWVDIATHYRGLGKANEIVIDKIRAGEHGGGPWQMPPHPEVSKADAATMARYILAIRN